MEEESLNKKLTENEEKNIEESYNEELPTIFELNAHDNFHSLIQPAISHLLKVCLPGLCRGGKVNDDLACLIHLTVESLSLHFNGTSLSEFFYDFRRLDAAKGHPSVRSMVVLLYLVFFPYVRLKLEKKFLEEQNDDLNKDSKLTLSYLASLYPQLNAFYEGLTLVTRVTYALGRSKYFSPLLFLLGTPLSRNLIHQAPAYDIAAAEDTSTRIWRKFNIKALLANMALVLVGCFQFLEWWQREDRPPITLFPIHLPPYPPTEAVTNELVFVLCPLCRRRRHNHTVVATSGYVFCNACISAYVSEHGSCPVTGFPAKSDTLVKLYVHNTSQ